MQANLDKLIKISVIIPTFNEEFYIRNTILAIKKQKCDIPYEIFVSDGQSTDNTVNVAKTLANVVISPQRGKSYQLNYIVPKTSGEILVFLDADTIIPPRFLQKIYSIFQKRKKLLACSARFKYTNGRHHSLKIGPIKFTLTTYFFQNFGINLFYFMRTLLRYPELSGCNIIVRRDIFLKIGGFKNPPKSYGIDRVFSDSILFLIKKIKYGKIKTLTFLSVLTSGRKLSIKRGLSRYYQYHSKKKVYSELTSNINV